MSRFFYERKVRCQAHLLDTLNDVIGPIEKILEAFEKKVSAQNSHFSEISISNQMTFFQKFQKSLHFLAYNQFGAPYVPNFFTSVKCYVKRTF